jgi:hypothetical protein
MKRAPCKPSGKDHLNGDPEPAGTGMSSGHAELMVIFAGADLPTNPKQQTNRASGQNTNQKSPDEIV